MTFNDLRFKNSDYDKDGKLKPGAPAGQLYNMRKDPNQTTNLYNGHPEIVERLNDLSEQARKTGRSR